MTRVTTSSDLGPRARVLPRGARERPRRGRDRRMPLKVEFELEKAPEDGITCVEFCPAPASPLLLCSSWDCGLRLYDVQNNQLKAKIQHPFAVLDCCFSDPSHAFSGGLDRRLLHSDLATQQSSSLGSHEDGIRCVEYCSEVGVVVTGSWDKTIKLWDPRQKQSVG
ncbi:Mitotic checkpoint protein BUB3 [Geodia barretti]|nr:Mitotic checkpoint protein BUB3 [Geodia barretti]